MTSVKLPSTLLYRINRVHLQPKSTAILWTHVQIGPNIVGQIVNEEIVKI